MSQVIEFVEFDVPPEREAEFVTRRAQADVALRRFSGFMGSELLALQNGGWVLLVRWISLEAVQAAQQITLASPGLREINDWVALARQVKRFDTGVQRHLHVRSNEPNE